MKARTILATAALTGQLLATVALGITPASAASGLSTEAQARALVSRFFQTINARQFGQTCDLMSVRFYRENRIPDKRRCVLGLTVGFANSPTVFFRILGVRHEGDRAIVRTLANGEPGKIVLIKEAGSFRVLSVGF